MSGQGAGFLSDSRHVDRVLPARGYRRGRWAKRERFPVGVIVHTTGAGPVKRWQNVVERERFEYRSPLDAALRIYGHLMDAGPHYVVGQCGTIVQVGPESTVAWHVGSKGAGRYGRAWRWHRNTDDVQWWSRRWPHLALVGPRGLAGGRLWDGGSCNANTIGIEVVPPESNVKGPWSAEAWEALACLALDIEQRVGVPFDRETWVAHSDAHPLDRSANGAPWDPGPRQWQFEWLRREVALRAA